MRFLVPVLLLSTLPILADNPGCGSEPATITAMRFPATFEGDGSVVSGELDFVDPDAGTNYLTWYASGCPSGTCSSGTYDLTGWNPDIVNLTSGTIPLGLSCDNPTGTDFTFSYGWYLEQSNGDTESNIYKVSFTCLGVYTALVPPVILTHTPPTVVTATLPSGGSLTFSDENAGVKYLLSRPVSCPSGVTCNEEKLDLAGPNAPLLAYTSGTITYNLTCDNPGTTDVNYTLGFKLEDTQGNQSNEVIFSFVCLPAPTGARTSQVLKLLQGSAVTEATSPVRVSLQPEAGAEPLR